MSIDQIADHLGLPVERIQETAVRIENHLSNAVLDIAMMDERAIESFEERRTQARRLLQIGRFIDVEVPTDSGYGDVHVGFRDLASHTFSELVDESVALMLTLPGVDCAIREDRGLVVVWGGVSPARIEAELRIWWRRRLEDLVQVTDPDGL